VDGYVKLKYFDRDLYQGTPGGPRDVTLDDTRREVMERFVKTMKHKMTENNSPNAEWVLVGHSQGGIVARLLHEHIRKNASGVEVEGVLSIASPMQGGKPSQVSYGSRSGYTNVKPIIDGFLKDVLVGPLGDAGGDLLNFVVPGLGAVFDIIANIWDPTTYAAEGVIDLFEGKLKALNEMAVEKEAKEAIGPDGELIQSINRAPNPDSYRALLGAERAPVAARVASGRRIEKDRVVTFGLWGGLALRAGATTSLPNLGLSADVFTANDKVSPGEEPETVDFFNEVKDSYANAADYYRYRCYGTFGISCLAGDYRKWDRWKQGRRAIQNFGSTYTQIVNAFRLERKTRKKYVCDKPSLKNKSDKGGGFNPPSASEYKVSYRIKDGDCHYEYETYYASVPNKNDGLLGTATNTWDPPSKGSAPKLGSHSILYNDRSSSSQYKRGGTGYNHAEMVYNKRRYSASEDPGISDGEFGKGQPNPPMQNGENFLERQVF
jgi:pimeloyl-ACP methyl ester carboxylesterase